RGQERLLGQCAVSLSPEQVAAGPVVCAGAALLPDIDHHNGRIANTFGPITQHMCKWIGKISGGHRQATHSILFALAIGWAMDFLATHHVYAWWACLFRSEEHTSELQSRENLVCRLLLEKKKQEIEKT